MEFTIQDADPGDRYECIVYYRCTSGSRTWAGNEYWAATKTINKDIDTTIPVTIELADPDTPGGLDPDVHEWGTYTFDVRVIEYVGGVEVDKYSLKTPYCLWVSSWTPESPPREGHKGWIYVPEDGSGAAEMRASYWLNDQGQRDAAELEMVVIDPALQEAGAPTVGNTAINTMHGDPDGIKLYTFQGDDPSGRWRVVWTGADACGPHSRHRRTHDEPRMLAANDDDIERRASRLYLYRGPDSVPSWDLVEPAAKKIHLPGEGSGGQQMSHRLAETSRRPQQCAEDLWSFLCGLPENDIGYKWALMHTNTHSSENGCAIEVCGETNGNREVMLKDNHDPCPYPDDSEIEVAEVDRTVENLGNDPDVEQIHFWMAAACDTAKGAVTPSFAEAMTQKGVTVAAGFEKHVVDAQPRWAFRYWAIHGHFMKCFYEECAKGKTISTALNDAIVPFKKWLTEGLFSVGYYDNPKGDSTEYYGYDTSKVFTAQEGKSYKILDLEVNP